MAMPDFLTYIHFEMPINAFIYNTRRRMIVLQTTLL
jgi:hypothetical protein